MAKHDALVKRAKKGDVDIAFFGDSITEGMNETLLHQIFGDKAEHFGIGGDRTQNLIWRLRNGELDFGGKPPKSIVLLMGTNNLRQWGNVAASTNAEIRDGVKLNLDEFQKRLPDAHILLLGILPRDEKPYTSTRRRLKETNLLLQKLADNKHVWYADIGAKLTEPDGKISKEIMPDFLHPSAEKGYDAMFKAIKPELDAMK
ncbi:MAG: hypothetical protein K2X81_23580 [Candidatus Obscuribacterales bacterium]|nr:hypothetical protein [Candidatus Obscuribacterales bacterium]